MERSHGRLGDQMRPMAFTPHYSKMAYGSVLVEYGETKVLCAVSVEDGVPIFLKGSQPAQGWLTAEYSMLPSSTTKRTRRERQFVGGRTQEIQRLIGRSLRGVIDLKKIPDLTLTVDCDVIQADGGTRTAAITGGYVALKLAVDRLLREGAIRSNPLTDVVGAVAVGIKDDEILVDVDYKEDSSIDLDMNIVMTQSGKLLEIQGTGEGAAFTKEQVAQVIEAAEQALNQVFEMQMAACEGRRVES